MPPEPASPPTAQYDYTPLPRSAATGMSWWLFIVLLTFLIVFGSVLRQFLAAALWVLALVAIGYGLWARHRQQQAVDAFAARNGLQPATGVVPPAVADLGNNEHIFNAYQLLAGESPCIVYDYTYMTGEGRSRQTHYLSVAWLSNSKPYPHLFLDGKQNGASYTYQSSQRVPLEGDFDDYFNLYVPNGEQVDALSVITPDVMQTLVEGGRPYDIEIIDDAVFVIAKNTSYTAEKLPALLQFCGNLMREFDERSVSWQPLSLPTESWQTDTLKRNRFRSYVIIAVAITAIFGYFIITSLASR